MIFISHRGNIDGRKKARENTVSYIHEALRAGYHVEIDIWFQDGRFYLGHDHPDVICPDTFIADERTWLHTKNFEALEKCVQSKAANFFWHQEDAFTLTSSGFIWTYPGHEVSGNSIAVVTSKSEINNKLSVAAGICSDYIHQCRNIL